MMRLFGRKSGGQRLNKARTPMEQALNQFMKNRMAVGGLLVIILLFAVAFSTIVIDFVTRDAIYNNYVINQNLAQRLAAPSASHIFGCDEFGRIYSSASCGARNILCLSGSAPSCWLCVSECRSG